MDPEDESDPNVCLIQCALFCKGYHAGGITGIYYNAGVAAVKEMQEDANIGANGIINWKVWMGLFSMYWFKLVAGGNPTIRLIQRQINQDYSSNIGVQACDGVMSRNTSLSLVAALQVTLGMHTWIDDLNTYPFGPATASLFAEQFGTLKNGKNGGQYTKPNKLAQYGLYFNGINQTKFDGIFDSQMASNVAKFQDEYGLTGMIAGEKSGEISYGTMWSLLTSRGDPNRLALACDTLWQLNDIQAKNLYDAGYRYIGRYLTGTAGYESSRDKELGYGEIARLTRHGFSIFPIYQNGSGSVEYFQRPLQGSNNAVTALQRANELGFQIGTTIYFAVDFDCLDYQTENYIIPYFQQIKNVFNQVQFNPRRFKVGIYGPRLVCTKVSEFGYADYSFVSDMSTGFSGNLGYPIPKNWSFDQFDEFLFSSQPSFDLDKCGYSGRDSGCLIFDNSYQSIGTVYEAQCDYVKRIIKNINLLGTIAGITLDFNNKTYPLGTLVGNGIRIAVSITLDSHLKISENASNKINIQTKNGELTSEVKSQIDEICINIKNISVSNFTFDTLMNIALNMSIGTLAFSYISLAANEIDADITCETDQLTQIYGIEGTVSCTIHMNVKIDNSSIDFRYGDVSKITMYTVALIFAIVFAAQGGSIIGIGIAIYQTLAQLFPVIAKSKKKK